MRVKIFRSPFHSPLEVAGDIVLKLHVPYTATSTSIQVNPNIQEYQENANGELEKVSQLMVTTATDETRTLMFELNGVRTHRIAVAGSTYEIELVNAGEEVVKNLPARFFEFEVQKQV